MVAATGDIEPTVEACPSRIARLRDVTAVHGLIAVLVTDPDLIAGLSGVRIETAGVMRARVPWLLVGTEGDARFLAHSAERGLVTQRLPDHFTAHFFPDRASMCESVRDWLGGARHGKVGVDSAGLSVADCLRLGLPEDAVVDVERVIRGIIRGRSPADLDYLRWACRILSDATRGACSTLESGRTESDLAGEIASRLYSSGGTWSQVVPIACAGDGLRVGHARPSLRRLTEGSMCRVGVRAIAGPFHVMYVRTGLVRETHIDLEANKLATLTRAHRELVSELYDNRGVVVGSVCGPGGFQRSAVPVVQGMGISFKEEPASTAGFVGPMADGDTVLISTILEDPTGLRVYWQEMAAVSDGRLTLLAESRHAI